MFSFFKQRIICPYCLAEIRGGKSIQKCPKCTHQMPPQYVNNYESHPPFFVQVFGWSQVGKSVYLQTLTLMLVRMAKVWSSYYHTAATNASQQIEREVNEYLSKGTMPPPTPIGLQQAYIMVLDGMERWGGRTLVTRDCAGEVFDNLSVPIEQAPFLLNAPTTFMLISLADLPESEGRSINMLMSNYVNTLLQNGVDFNKEQRKLVVVLTKGDIIPNLPNNLRNYLVNDPLWAAVNSTGTVQQMDAQAMQEYITIMGRVSDNIRDWIKETASGLAFIRLAEAQNIDLRFSIVSSTGAPVNTDGTMPIAVAPRRVLDPYFWALDLQSY